MDGDDTAPLGPLAHALAAARPTEPGLARQLRLRSVLAGVLGVEPPPPRLDRYVIERQVGAGGMGVVYRGHDPATGAAVAIKLLDHGARFERRRFAREARVLRDLSCPGVVRYLDHGTTGDDLDYLVMEWLDGEDLAARLRAGPLSVRDAIALGAAVARTLIQVHAAGVVHRDVKPSNVFLCGGGVDDVRLVDFGVARVAAPEASLTATGAVVGTPSYMAPEQLRGVADARTDIYGLGATLFEALAGRPPFVAQHPGALMLAVLAEAPPSLVALRPEIPGAVDALLGHMLAKAPAERPVDMAAVATELAQLAADLATARGAASVLSRAERTPALERTPPPDDGEPVVGRERPLAVVAGVVGECAAEAQAALVLIAGDAGAGKSALLGAVADAIAARPGWRCLVARGHREAQGVPFAVVRALVRDDGEVAAAALAALLHDGAAAAAEDPWRHGDRVLLAWLDRLEAWSAAGPLAIIVDDVDLADRSSRRLLARALAHLAERPCLVVATLTGPVAAAAGLGLAGALPDARVAHVHLGPLGRRAAARLAGRWAPALPAADRARLVELAAGNVAHLRELARAAVDGAAVEAGSVAALVWARLERLAPEVRRTLRAASIVGRALWPGAVATLLGVAADDAELARRLDTLVDRGHLWRAATSSLPGEPQLEFTSELERLAAYELSGDVDRRAGHAAVAAWLATRPGHAATQLAGHLDGAGRHAEAARHHLAAARAALAGGDAALFDATLAGARHPDAPAEVVAEATALASMAMFWRGELRGSLEAAAAALAALPAGDEAWFGAASLAITAAGQLGDHPRLSAVAAQVVATPPRDAAAGERRVIAASRALSQLLAGGGHDTAALEAVAAARPLDELGAEARAWRHRVDAAVAATGSFDVSIGAIVAAHRAYVEAGDVRSAALMGIYLGSYYVWSGGWERARTAIDDAMRTVRRLDVDYLALWGRYAEAKLLVETASHEEAWAALAPVIAGADSSPRIRAGAQVYAALAAARAGAQPLALERADAARATHASTAAAATAVRVRALLAQGRVAEAGASGAALAAAVTAQARIVEFDELVRLAWAELCAAQGEGAAAARAAAVAAIHAKAQSLADPLRRNEYLGRPHLVVRTLSLAADPAP